MSENINEKIEKFNGKINDYREQIDNSLICAKEISIDEIMGIMIKIDAEYLLLCKELSELSEIEDDKKAAEFVDSILSEISEALLEYKGKIIKVLKRGRKS